MTLIPSFRISSEVEMRQGDGAFLWMESRGHPQQG